MKTLAAPRTRTVKSTQIVAVLGTGSIGTRHLKILKGLSQVKPIAIPVRAHRGAEWQKAGFTVAQDLASAFQAGARLCVIATDTARHAADTTAALNLGMDVLVEKPLAINAPEARAVKAVAERKGRQLWVGCHLRFSDSLNTFRRELPKLGHLHAIRIECQSLIKEWHPDRNYRDSYSARGSEGGVLRDLIHEIDYAGWIFGWPESLQAKLKNSGRLGIQSEEEAELFWETPTGVALSMRLDYLTLPHRRKIRVDGENGRLEWDGIQHCTDLELIGQKKRRMKSTQKRDDLYKLQLQSLTGSYRGSSFQPTSSHEAIQALAICDAARIASETNRKIKVNYHGS